MLRLQQYEKLLKALNAQQQLSGPIQELTARREARNEAFATQSLGKVMRSFLDSYLVTEEDATAERDESWVSPDSVSIDLRVHLQMSEEQIAQTEADLYELLALRNRLVHHLLDQFDIGSLDGCEKAAAYLTDCYTLIDKRHEALVALALQTEEVRVESIKFMQSAVFLDMVADGICPDGTIHWPGAGIARVLRQAAAHLTVDGWTSLKAAVEWLRTKHPDQLPARYGCKSWQQVLNDSQAFDLVYRISESGQRAPWYRPRSTLTQ
jgi:hypothetical protein